MPLRRLTPPFHTAISHRHLATVASVAPPLAADLSFAVPCLDGYTAAFDWEANPFLYGLIFAISAADLFALPLFRWRYRFRRAWMHVQATPATPSLHYTL